MQLQFESDFATTDVKWMLIILGYISCLWTVGESAYVVKAECEVILIAYKIYQLDFTT